MFRLEEVAAADDEVSYGTPEKYGGSYASWAFKVANPESSAIATKQVSFPDVYDIVAQTYKNMNVSEAGDYQLVADASKVSCPASGGCTFNYHFIRKFEGDIAIEAATERMYEIYAFYDTKDDRAFSKPVNLLLGAFNSLAASTVATAAALLLLTI